MCDKSVDKNLNRKKNNPFTNYKRRFIDQVVKSYKQIFVDTGTIGFDFYWG